MIDRTRRRRAARAGVVAALVLGCFSKSPPPRFFTLASTLGREAGAPAARSELGIAVGAVEFPRYLDRPEIVTRDGAHRLVVWDDQRWGGSLRSDLQRIVADDLAALLGTTRVVVYPNEPRFPLDYRVLVDVLEFEGVPGGSVRLRARWIVASGADGRALAVEESRIDEPVASAAFEDLVAAHSAALGRLTREIAARIGALRASR
jgi:hypothetical protein